jgi:hypothetical protein
VAAAPAPAGGVARGVQRDQRPIPVGAELPGRSPLYAAPENRRASASHLSGAKRTCPSTTPSANPRKRAVAGTRSAQKEVPARYSKSRSTSPPPAPPS